MRVIETERGISRGQKQFLAAFKPHTNRQVWVRVGFPGGHVDDYVAWLGRLGIWMLSREIDTRYWNVFGVGEPFEGDSLSITCQINFPYVGIDRRIAGVLTEDVTGRVYVAHRGKIGGGRAGIGLEAFAERYDPRRWRDVVDGQVLVGRRWEDILTPMVVIGALDEPALPEAVATFVHEVARIKAAIVSAADTPSTQRPSVTATPPAEPPADADTANVPAATDGAVRLPPGVPPLARIRSVEEFVTAVAAFDGYVCTTEETWGPVADTLIFHNRDANRGLLLLTLCSWLSIRAKASAVFGSYLQQANEWLDGGRLTPPRHLFPHSTPHLELTKRTLDSRDESIGAWFAREIIGVVREHGSARGNLYRLAGAMIGNLYRVADNSIRTGLACGTLPAHFSGADHKRFWMLLAWLRRDRSEIGRMLGRALSSAPGGAEALHYWYDDRHFSQLECKLPVDVWVHSQWTALARRLRAPELTAKTRQDVAERARALAHRHRMSPAAFDVLYREW